jgi:prepilin-type N-terminal cleavage/methylation domain-containing protein/prepilin-type processing-associated H-X9-DG protein
MNNRVVVRKKGGFTLIELLVVIAIIAVLASMILPALSRAKIKAQQVTDLNNLKQMTTAWIMYAGDNRDKLVLNTTGGTNSWIDSNIGSMMDNVGCTNVAAIKLGLLYFYNPNPGIYQCPTAVLGNSYSKGKRLARNYSMEGRMGSTLTDIYTVGTYKTLGSINKPGPAQSIVFIDESTATIDDGVFAVQAPNSYDFQNAPTARHLNSAVFSFADGHVDKHKWMGLAKEQGLDTSATTPELKKDLRWIQDRVYPPK